MADLSDAKKPQGSIYPEGAYDSGGGPTRVEPLLTAELFQRRHLFGIPLYSPFNPKDKLGPDDFRDYITRGIGMFELDSGLTVSPLMRRIRLPFDPNLYYMNIWLEVPWKPVQRVKRLAICSASYQDTEEEGDKYPPGAQIYRIPTQWLDLSYAKHGRLFVNPINPAFASVGFADSMSSSGATILQFIGIQGWVPAYWTIEAEIGFCSSDGTVPVVINEAIGLAALIMLLPNLIPLFRTQSQSLSIDGMGQSISDNIAALLTAKLTDAQQRYNVLVDRLKTNAGSKFFATNV